MKSAHVTDQATGFSLAKRMGRAHKRLISKRHIIHDVRQHMDNNIAKGNGYQQQ